MTKEYMAHETGFIGNRQYNRLIANHNPSEKPILTTGLL